MPDRPPLKLTVVAASHRRSGPVRCDEPDEPHPDEFSRGQSAWDDRFSRRNFLTLAGASLALAGVTGCSDRPNEAIVPYVDPPEQVVAGEPQFFATTLTRAGYGRGVIVTSREGRPVKIEGNPDHPASLGAADVQMQAAVLGLYDPLRSVSVTHAGQPTDWGAFLKALRAQVASHAADGGTGLAILTGSTTSPTVARLMAKIRAALPNAQWHAYEPLGRYASISSAADGQRCEAVYDFSKADVVVAFDADFLSTMPGSLTYARAFAARRRPDGPTPMSRVYVAEADVTITGSRADHRLAVRPSRVGTLLAALATQMGLSTAKMSADLTNAEADWLSAVATDLANTRGRAVLVAGDGQPAVVHALAHHLNDKLGNVGSVVRYVRSSLLSPDAGQGVDSLKALTDAMRNDAVRSLLILADNPVRTAPADVPFGDELARMSRRENTFTAHLGLYANESAFACQWHVPAQHELEQWGDATAFDGTSSIVQPLIAPKGGTRQVIDLLNAVLGNETSAYDAVRETWKVAGLPGDFDAAWTAMLRKGVAPAMPSTVVRAAVEVGDMPASPRGIDVVIRPDASVLDGSLFYNPWLQELPRPMTKIVWGNAALLSPALMARLGLFDGDVVRLDAGGRTVDAPVQLLPLVPDDTVVLHLGYGEHKLVGGDAAWTQGNVPLGVDAYPLRTAASPSFTAGVSVTNVGRKQKVVRTHGHHDLAADVSADPSVKKTLTPVVVASPDVPEDELRLHNRKLIRTATLSQFSASPGFAAAMDEGDIKQLYPAWDYSTGPQWGMTIDLNACIGCQACVVACQAENNIPTVGPEQVDAQREMHWLRVDQYVDTRGTIHNQPVPCMHCENAPCEYVCPVAATTHSVDGLNQMTYNRCVGTRYCSNNCPYKVRRFNFLNYTFYKPQEYKQQANPDVTVRTRGVMEKCSYCVQRLVYADRKTEIATVNAGDTDTTQLRNDIFGRVQTACQQTCPTRAIEFGDLTNKASPVAQSKQNPRNYGILVELSTKPRTTYLAGVTNPSPMLAGEKGGA